MGLRANGSLALGVTGRCLSLLGPSDLDDEYATARHRLDTASVDELPARANASDLCMRSAAMLVAASGGGAVASSHRATACSTSNVLARTEPNERNSAPSVNSHDVAQSGEFIDLPPDDYGRLMANGPIHDVIERWHQHMRGQLPGGLDELLHDDVVFLSPVVFTPRRARPSPRSTSTPQARRFLVKHQMSQKRSLTAVTHLSSSDIRKIVDGHHAMLEFETTVDGKASMVSTSLRATTTARSSSSRCGQAAPSRECRSSTDGANARAHEVALRINNPSLTKSILTDTSA